MRRPLPIAVGVTALLVLLGTPFLRLSVGLPDERVLPESSEARQVSERIHAEFPGDSAEAFSIVVERTDDPAALAAYAADVSSIAGVARVEGLGGVYKDGEVVGEASGSSAGDAPAGAALLEVVPTVDLQSGAGEQLVEDIRALEPGFDTLVGGSAAQLIDTKDALLARLPWALAIIAVTTLVLLFLMTGSVLIPIKALVLNLLSLTATFGAMVWVFQDGNLSGLLDFTATGRIDSSMPILMFCIAFGLSMDYEVFLLSRIKEEYDRTGQQRGIGGARARADRADRERCRRPAGHHVPGFRHRRRVVPEAVRGRPGAGRGDGRHGHPRPARARLHAPGRAGELVGAGDSAAIPPAVRHR